MENESSTPLQIDWLPEQYNAPGKLGLTQLPGRKDLFRSLPADISALLAAGVSHVVPLVTDGELQEYGVAELLHAYQVAGLQVRRLPIPDMGISTPSEMLALVEWLGQETAAGGRILLHCVGGLGRSGMAAACYLRSCGLPAEAAIAVVRQARSPKAIETRAQEQFVADFIS